MEKWNTPIQISSRRWLDNYHHLKNGDLVWVGPVQRRVPGIIIERKKASFGYDPDEWYVLVEGQIESYPSYLIADYLSELLEQNDNYRYNSYAYYGD